MTLSQLDLDLMEYSDKSLKFGTIILSNEYMRFLRIEENTKIQLETATCFKSSNIICGVIGFDEKNIIGSPFGRGRVCMFRKKHDADIHLHHFALSNMHSNFNKNPELYDMDCLSWDDETKMLVLDFLNSLSINK